MAQYVVSFEVAEKTPTKPGPISTPALGGAYFPAVDFTVEAEDRDGAIAQATGDFADDKRFLDKEWVLKVLSVTQAE